MGAKRGPSAELPFISRKPRHGEAQSPTGIQFCVLDISSEAAGVFHIWGTTQQASTPLLPSKPCCSWPDSSVCVQESLLVRVTDFQPSFWIAAPRPEQAELQACLHLYGSRYAKLCTHTGVQGQQLEEQQLDELQQHLNRHLPHGSKTQRLSVGNMLPIMYYRPAHPDPTPHLKVCASQALRPGLSCCTTASLVQVHLQPGANLKKASTAVRDVAKGRHPCPGWEWGDDTLHEHEASCFGACSV